MRDAIGLDHAGDHGAEIGQAAIAAALEVMGIKRKAHHAAGFGHRANDRVALVAQGGVPIMRVGMGHGDGAGGMAGGLDRRAVGRMAHIHDHAHPVHLGDDFAAHAGQTRIFGLIATRREQRLVVVAQLHEAQAKPVPDLDQPDIIFDRAGVLCAEKDRRAPLGAGAAHIVAGQTLKDQIGMIFEPAVPAFDIEDRLAKCLVIGDGDMHGIHPTFAHLGKDLG